MNKIFGFLLFFIFLASPFVFAGERARVSGSKLRHEQRLEMQDFKQQQAKEDGQIEQDIKQLPPAQRSKAIKDYLEGQHSEETEFLKQQHEENMSFLKNKISASSNMSDEQKEELINFFESQYQEKISLKEQQYNENVVFFEKIAGDSSLTIAQKKEAINAYIKANWQQTDAAVNAQGEQKKTKLNQADSAVKTEKAPDK